MTGDNEGIMEQSPERRAMLPAARQKLTVAPLTLTVKEWEAIRAFSRELNHEEYAALKDHNDQLKQEENELYEQWVAEHGPLGPGYVYVLYMLREDIRGVFKIGATHDFHTRMIANKRTWGEFKIFTKKYTKDPFDLEKRLHQKFWHKHVKADLFRLDMDDINALMEVK